LFKDFSTPKVKNIQTDVFRHLSDAQLDFTMGFDLPCQWIRDATNLDFP